MYPGFRLLNDTETIPLAYGEIHALSQNMTGTGWTGTKTTMKLWGLRCWLNSQEGQLNLIRLPTSNWQIYTSCFSDEKIRVPSYLAPWQTNLMYRAPQSTIAGIGPALALSASNTSEIDVHKNTDFKILALNYLYASGEAERAIFEVATTNTSRDLPEDFFTVAGLVNEQHYRITYIPIILLVGIIALLMAATVVLAMVVYTSKTVSARIFREVNMFRLLVDTAGGLYKDIKPVVDAGFENSEMEDWANDYKVGYESMVAEGEARVRLRSVGGSGYEKGFV
jgi:hypothetical protein